MSALVRRSAPLRRAFGEVAREKRQRDGLSQAAVAQRAGISVELLRAIEEGRADASILVYVRLARLGLRSDLAPLILVAEQAVGAAPHGSGGRAKDR